MDHARASREPVLNADAAAQLRLLDVQELDAKIDLLGHRARTLPEHAEIERLAGESDRLRDLVVGAETEESDLEREVAKAEADVEQVRQRTARDQQRLDAGTVSSAKELESLQHEIASLGRRQADLEEIELEVMERLESTQAHLAKLRVERSAIEESQTDAVQRRHAATVDLEKDSAFARDQRASVVGDVPDDLLALYEKLRADLGGIGAAALVQRRCGGCRLELNTVDIGRIRSAAPDEVLRCEECRRILIRTDESGL